MMRERSGGRRGVMQVRLIAGDCKIIKYTGFAVYEKYE